MLARRVMTDAAAVDDPRLGWMQVAARRVDAQRPPRLPVLLPGGESHRAAKELPYRVVVNRPWWNAGREERAVRNVSRQRRARQLANGRGVVPSERIRL